MNQKLVSYHNRVNEFLWLFKSIFRNPLEVNYVIFKYSYRRGRKHFRGAGPLSLTAGSYVPATWRQLLK